MGSGGPSHFHTSRAPTGAILLKRRHLELLEHALVSVPYWEWNECKASGDREQYLRGKLEARHGMMRHPHRVSVMHGADDDDAARTRWLVSSMAAGQHQQSAAERGDEQLRVLEK